MGQIDPLHNLLKGLILNSLYFIRCVYKCLLVYLKFEIIYITLLLLFVLQAQCEWKQLAEHLQTRLQNQPER